MSPRETSTLHRLYDAVHMVLWATLSAAVIMFLVFVLPKLPEARMQAQVQRELALEAEEAMYCEKWGQHAGMPQFSACTIDVRTIRSNALKRRADDMDF